MAIDDERVRKLADDISSATKAYEKGARINDSMTVAEARWLYVGRLFAEAISRGKPMNPKVIDAKGRLNGGKS